jgi:predicted dienelactone hydrolase
MWRILQFVVFVVAVLIGLCRTVYSFDTGKDGDGRRFNVGYRTLDLKYQGTGGETVLTVAVWYPTAVSPKPHIYGGTTAGQVAVDAEPLAQGAPYPLLVFSHGYGGSGLGSVFFTEQLAARGWIVAAPDHHDRHSAVRIRTGQKRDFDRLGLLRDAREIANSGPADRDAYLYRIQELKLVLDRMLESNQFGKLIDWQKIAVGGHSLGGFTALGLCGTIDRLRNNRIKALLLFSTGAGGYLFEDSELAAVKVPSMILFGERERGQKRGTRTMGELAEKVYKNLPPPRYLLEIMGANHFSFNNRFSDKWAARILSGNEGQFQVIRRYSIAFLERYVAGKIEAEKTLQHQDPLLTRYLKESSHQGPRN